MGELSVKLWYTEKDLRIKPNGSSDGVALEVRAWTSNSTWFTLYSNLPRLVKEALGEPGI